MLLKSSVLNRENLLLLFRSVNIALAILTVPSGKTGTFYNSFLFLYSYSYMKRYTVVSEDL